MSGKIPEGYFYTERSEEESYDEIDDASYAIEHFVEEGHGKVSEFQKDPHFRHVTETYSFQSEMRFEMHGTRTVIVVTLPFLENYDLESHRRFVTCVRKSMFYACQTYHFELANGDVRDFAIYNDELFVIAMVDESTKRMDESTKRMDD